jgi:hypothetical protein
MKKQQTNETVSAGRCCLDRMVRRHIPGDLMCPHCKSRMPRDQLRNQRNLLRSLECLREGACPSCGTIPAHSLDSNRSVSDCERGRFLSLGDMSQPKPNRLPAVRWPRLCSFAERAFHNFRRVVFSYCSDAPSSNETVERPAPETPGHNKTKGTK